MDDNAKNAIKQFMRLHALMHHYHFWRFREAGPAGNPLRGQGRVLCALKLKNEISQKDLGLILDMRNQSLMELLSRLEKSGYITRRQSETDKRTMIVTLTESGVAAAERIDDPCDDLEELFACFSSDEQAVFAGFIERLIAAIEKLLGGSASGDFDEKLMEQIEEWHGMHGGLRALAGHIFGGARGFGHGFHACRKDRGDRGGR